MNGSGMGGFGGMDPWTEIFAQLGGGRRVGGNPFGGGAIGMGFLSERQSEHA